MARKKSVRKGEVEPWTHNKVGVRRVRVMAFTKRLCSGSFSRSLLRAGNSNGPQHGAARALYSVLAESYYNDEQKEMQATAKKLIDAEINPVQSTKTLTFKVS